MPRGHNLTVRSEGNPSFDPPLSCCGPTSITAETALMHTLTCTCMYTYTHEPALTPACMHMCTHLHAHTPARACAQMCKNSSACTDLHVHRCTTLPAFTSAHTHTTCTYTCTLSDIHAHTCVLSQVHALTCAHTHAHTQAQSHSTWCGSHARMGKTAADTLLSIFPELVHPVQYPRHSWCTRGCLICVHICPTTVPALCLQEDGHDRGAHVCEVSDTVCMPAFEERTAGFVLRELTS